MSKGERIEHFVESLEVAGDERHSPFYLGYFRCFNEGNYYEAHDVLEHLWLQHRGNRFYKGLIQIAGAFVHLKKQALRPDHPKDGKRLRPAFRLFSLGMENVEPFGPVHAGLDVAGLLALCREYAGALERSGFTVNPWRFEERPVLVISDQ